MASKKRIRTWIGTAIAAVREKYKQIPDTFQRLNGPDLSIGNEER